MIFYFKKPWTGFSQNTVFSNGLHDIFKTSEPILMKFKPHILHINSHKVTYDRVKIWIFNIFFCQKQSEKKLVFFRFFVRHIVIY